MASALRVFKRHRETPYQTWAASEGEQEGLLDIDLEQPCEKARFLLAGDETTDSPRPRESAPEELAALQDCFYLGSYDMTGRTVMGRGCIDGPAADIWRQTQEGKDGRKIRRNKSFSRSLSLVESKPKYIRLVAGEKELKIVDNYSEEQLICFNYQTISYTGTHPKYTKMFCFVAWEPKNRTPFCHAFKCENSLSAKTTALDLANVFKKKCTELAKRDLQHSSCSITPQPVLRKTISLQSC